MSNSDDRRDDQMRELECLRLASELRQLAKELPRFEGALPSDREAMVR